MRTIAGAVAVVLLAVGAPAHAESWQGQDPRHDVATVRYDPNPPPCGTSTVKQLPKDRKRDIVGLTVGHALDDVRLDLALRQVDDRKRISVTFNLRSSAKDRVLVLSRNKPDGPLSVLMYRQPDPEPSDSPCASYSYVIHPLECEIGVATDPGSEVITATVPRSCLGDPRWVRVAARVDARRAPYAFDVWGEDQDRPKNPLVGPLSPRVSVGVAP